MKNTCLFMILASLPAALPAQEFSTAAMRSINLSEAYKLSLARSEQLAMQEEFIKQLDAAERALDSAFRPAFALHGSRSKQQNAAASSRGFLSGNYVLFSGMRDYISLKAASARTGTARLDLDRARQQLSIDVAQAYLGLVAAQRAVFISREQMAVTARRVTELQSRADIGRSRKSEVVAAKTQLAQDKAGYLDALAAERNAQQALMFLTGLDTDMAPADIAPVTGAALEPYLKLAMARPDIASRRKTLEAYGYLADIQDRNTWPTAEVAADYFVLRNPMPDPVNRWDAALTLNLPLYTGGFAAAQRRSAYAARRSAELDLRLAERQALTEVRSAYESYKYSILQAASLSDALALALDNARYQAEDYKLGLVANLEVLSSLNAVQQTRLALSQARAQEVLSFMKLEAAAGVEAKP
ncbi:MAG: TolC family protein [Elusimicrobiales bacterium]|jgi:outer membrane protein TolC